MFRRVLVALAVSGLVGCAGGGEASPDGGPGSITRADGSTVTLPPEQGCPAGQHTTIRGRITFPNGTLPVAGALVYVAYGAAEPTHSGQCGECIDASGLAAHATTGIDGTFELVGVPAGAQMLVVEKGKFRRATPITVAQCTANTPPDQSLRLPASTAEGRIPHIAVVTGDYDRMEVVLGKLGLAQGSFEVIDDSGGGGGAALFGDMARLSTYDIVFVNCGSDIGTSVDNTEAPLWANARAFVQGGGRLYVTDLSYNLIEQTFAERIDFAGSSGDGLTATAESPQVAGVGQGISGEASVMDPSLGAWLMAAGATTNPASIHVTNNSPDFAVMDRIDGMRAKAWVEGTVESGDGYEDWGGDDYDDWEDEPAGAPAPAGGSTARRPLTVTFEHGCGRALYTSYHTVEDSWDDLGGMTSPALNGQEMILAYLVLEIGACIQEPTLF